MPTCYIWSSYKTKRGIPEVMIETCKQTKTNYNPVDKTAALEQNQTEPIQ
jgi:hypothetical protein